MSTVLSPIGDAIILGAMPAPTRAAYSGATSGFTGEFLAAPTPLTTITGAATVTQTVGSGFASPLNKDEFLFDFYDHIWVVPVEISLLNPQIGQPQSFQIWNAYLSYSGNTLTSIGVTGGSTLGLNFTSPLAFTRLEYLDATVTIENASIVNIDALFTFTFAEGVGYFTLLASLISVLVIPSEAPINEVWNWKTNVFVGIDNTEQRVGLRLVPYRTMKQTMIALTDADVRNQMFQSLYDFNGSVLIPYWQYSATISAANVIGDITLSFNPAYTDIRVGEYVLLSNPAYTQQQIAIVATITTGGCTLTSALEIPLPVNSTICPALTSAVADKWSLARYAVNSVAKLEINTTTMQGRSTLSRPNSTATITIYATLPVLDFGRPTLEGETQSVQFETHVDSQNYNVGNITNINNWLYTETIYSVSYLIHRVTNTNDMDWWRAFGTSIIGSLKPFLLPTWRDDLVIVSTVIDATNTFVVSGTDYYYMWQAGTNRHLMLQTTAGITYVTVASVAMNTSGDTVLTLSVALPSGYNVISTVSLLAIVRLADDKFSFTHNPTDTTVSLVARTIGS
jgi:hypothetical protein